MSTLHPIRHLFDKLAKDVDPYCPKGITRVPKRIPGLAFFPGGAGLWKATPSEPLPSFPVGKIMVLGHDFGSEDMYKRSLANGRENPDGRTWGPLLQLLRQTGIRPDSCFFTNSYMGLRRGKKATDKFPGASDQQFTKRCREFLAAQIAMQKPRLILTLGWFVPRFIAPLSPDLVAWRRYRTFGQLDELRPVARDVRFEVCAELSVTLVALVHPSCRRVNVKGRRYGEVKGDRAELAMLEDALRESGVEKM